MKEGIETEKEGGKTDVNKKEKSEKRGKELR